MSFRGIVRDIREGFGSISKRSFDVRLSGHRRGKSQGTVHELHDHPLVIQTSSWANLPPELLRDVIKRLDASECTWPARKHVVACASVCRSWREICMEIVKSPEISGKITFPISMKQPGARDGTIQCFIKRDKANLSYHLFLCLSPGLLVENGKFLLSAKRTKKTPHMEYVISMDSNNISRSSSSYVGKLRSNFLGTKFIIYDTQPPNHHPKLPTSEKSRRFSSKKVSPKLPTRNHKVAQVNYELNVLGTRGPRKMQCTLHMIPSSSLKPGGTVPDHPKLLEDSFRSSSRFSDIIKPCEEQEGDRRDRPVILTNKLPRWHEQLQCWCLNFKGRVTVALVKNFQLIAASEEPGGADSAATSAQPPQNDHEKVILQFGKVGKDMFTMDYRYPVSAFQAFAICLTSFDTKLACE